MARPSTGAGTRPQRRGHRVGDDRRGARRRPARSRPPRDLPADDRRDDAQVVVEHRDVGSGAGLEPAAVGQRRARRPASTSPSPRASGTAQPVKATRLRTRLVERAARCRRARPPALRTPSASTVTPTAPSRRATARSPSAATASVTRFSRSGPSARHAIAHGDRVDVDAVADRPGDDTGVGEGGADRTGIAVAERAHGVEQVRDVAGTGGAAGGELGGRGIGVAERHDDAPSDERRDHVEGAGQLGRDRRQPHAGVARPPVDRRRATAPPAGPRGGRPCGPATASVPRGAAPAAPRPARAPSAATASRARCAHIGRARDDRREERRHALLGEAPRRARRCGSVPW